MIKTVGVFLAALVALATTSAFSLRSGSTVADSVSKSADAGGGSRDATSRNDPATNAVNEPDEAVQVVPAEQAGTLPPPKDDPALNGANQVAGTINVGSDGSDGPFTFVADPGNANLMTIDLSQAQTTAWDTPSPSPGKGIYDPNKWAVVFKYSDVTIPSGKTVRFRNHPARAPVVWLVQTSATINGVVDLSGATFGVNSGEIHEPGPGGFRGGRGFLTGVPSSGGFGPGGANVVLNGYGNGGSYATQGIKHANNPISSLGLPYGYERVVPLIGGSGGGGRGDATNDGGGGGGAILIAAADLISVTSAGAIYANGGGYTGGNWAGAGSGGAIRLIANDLTLATGLKLQAVGHATGYTGGLGRIRIESNSITATGSTSPAYSYDVVDNPPLIWPEDAPQGSPIPSVYVTKLIVDGVDHSLTGVDPLADLSSSRQDLQFNTDNGVTVEVTAVSVPLDWQMVVRVVPVSGATIIASATVQPGGNLANSTWVSQPIALPKGKAAIQVRAYKP